MKAVWNNTTVAEAPEDILIRIEGNWYFPPDAIKKEYFISNNHHTMCPWKGEASYYDVSVNGQTSESGAWYYPAPKASAVERVRKDFGDYVAFWNGIEIIS